MCGISNAVAVILVILVHIVSTPSTCSLLSDIIMLLFTSTLVGENLTDDEDTPPGTECEVVELGETELEDKLDMQPEDTWLDGDMLIGVIKMLVGGGNCVIDPGGSEGGRGGDSLPGPDVCLK